MDLVVNPAEGRAKVYRRGSKVLMYVGKIHYRRGVVTITPCRGITAEQRAALVTGRGIPRSPQAWKRLTIDSGVIHLSMPVKARHLSTEHPHLLCSGYQTVRPRATYAVDSTALE